MFTTTGSLTATRPMIVFLWEFFGTFALTYVVFATAVTENAGTAAPLAIGLTLAADIFAMGRFTGGSMNPARTLGPAVAFWKGTNIWVYLLATFAGGAVGALLHDNVFKESDDEDKSQ